MGGEVSDLILSLVPNDFVHRITGSSTNRSTVCFPLAAVYRTDGWAPEIVKFDEFARLLNFRMQQK